MENGGLLYHVLTHDNPYQSKDQLFENKKMIFLCPN